jgi:hypothetical protein
MAGQKTTGMKPLRPAASGETACVDWDDYCSCPGSCMYGGQTRPRSGVAFREEEALGVDSICTAKREDEARITK